MEKIWTDEYKIHSYEMDARGKANLQILCKFMQESAYNHAENMRLGHSHLTEKELFWILSRLKIRIYRYPEWNDVITLHTWHSARDRLFYYRDFRIFDAEGKVIAIATTAWLSIDLESRRPVKLEEFLEIDVEDAEEVFDQKVGKLPKLQSGEKVKQIDTAYGDVDVNSHVNNIRYMDWVLDSYPLEFHKEHTLEEFEINFVSEALYGHRLIVKREEADDSTHLHSIFRESDGKDVVRVRILWRDK